jgi:hypothetical protein
MKLIALITIVTPEGEVPPGQPFEVDGKDEAESLVARGFAAKPAKADKPEAKKPEADKPEA